MSMLPVRAWVESPPARAQVVEGPFAVELFVHVGRPLTRGAVAMAVGVMREIVAARRSQTHCLGSEGLLAMGECRKAAGH